MKLFSTCLVAMLCMSAVIQCQLKTTIKSNITWSDIAGKLPMGCKLEKPEPANKDNVTCQGLWGKEGYVCNKDAVLRHAREDIDFFNMGIANFGKILDVMYNIVNFTLTKPITGLSFNETEKAMITKYSNTASFEQKKTNAAICMKKLASIRNAALCTMCSAKNTHSFNNDKKGLFLYGNCDSFLTICDPHFNDFIELYHTLDMVLKIDKAANPIPFFNQLAADFVETVKALSYLLTYRIQQRAAATNPKIKESISKEYCEQVIKLVLKPYLPASLVILNVGYSVIYGAMKIKYELQLKAAAIAADLAAKVAAAKLAASKIKSLFGNWRILQSLESTLLSLPPYNPEADISVVKDTDNMFGSFPGATGSDYQTEAYRPLNTTLSFP